MNVFQLQILAPILFIIGVILNQKINCLILIIILPIILKYLDKYISRLIVFFILGLLKGSFDNNQQKPYSYKYSAFKANIQDIQVREEKVFLLLNNFEKNEEHETDLIIKIDERAIYPNSALMELPKNCTEDFKNIKRISAIGRFLLPIPNASPYKNQIKIPRGKIKEIKILEYKSQTIKNYFRQKFYKYLKKSTANLCSAIFLADTFAVDNEAREEYNKAGVAHLLGVSILNLILILYLLYRMFYFILGRFCIRITNYVPLQIISKICSLSSILIYLYIIGVDYPLLRSFYMTFIATILLMFKKNNSLESLLNTAVIVIAINPNSIYDLGFQLSFSGVLGIYAFDNIKFKEEWKKILWTTFSVVTILSPVSIYNFQTFAIQPYIGNLIIIPFLSTIIIPIVIIYMFLPSILCSKFAILIEILFKILNFIVKITAKTSFLIRFNPINIKYLLIFLVFYILFAIIKENIRYIFLFLSYLLFSLGLYKAYCNFPFILVNNYAIALVKKDEIIVYKKNNFMGKQWSDLYKLPVKDGKNSEYFKEEEKKIIIMDKIAIIKEIAGKFPLDNKYKNYVFTFFDLEKTQIIPCL